MKLNSYIVILISILSTSCSSSFEWGFVTKLPNGAEIINQSAQTDDFLPDYDYYLTARMNESEFDEYRKEFNLTEHFDRREYVDENWSFDFLLKSEFDWWNPNFEENNSIIYVWQKREEWILAVHQNGIMYLHAMNH